MKKKTIYLKFIQIFCLYTLKKAFPLISFLCIVRLHSFLINLVSSHLDEFLPHTLPLLTSHLRSEDQNLT